MARTSHPWLRIFLPFAAGYFLSYLLRNVNAIIAPELMSELSVSAADLGLLTSAYLFAFGAFQLPLGILLDRYGPRRVETVLLLIAVVGCLLFSRGHDLQTLAVGRALIGLGVSACLMASFKAFSLWFPPERLASLNAAVMAAGGLGALTATSPLAWALEQTGWRGIFLALAALAFAVATGIFTTPVRQAAGTTETPGEQLRSIGGILASSAFWRYAPQAALVSGGFMALQGLWAVPWLMTVNGCTRDAAAFHLLLVSLAMLVGFAGLAVAVEPLSRRGLTPEQILVGGIGAGVAVMALIIFDAGPTQLLWFSMGLVFAISNLSYALLSEKFPSHLFGRVNSTLNIFVLGGAFGIQWGIGILVDAFGAAGFAQSAAFRLSFGALLAVQVLAWIVLLFPGKKKAR
ncbi:MAG TPA: MFS transporter [Candidatus Ozemobacteraceae bacterium]|nr:MFS transporter [Candidatus Ozemobacteraceae bacterium]